MHDLRDYPGYQSYQPLTIPKVFGILCSLCSSYQICQTDVHNSQTTTPVMRAETSVLQPSLFVNSVSSDQLSVGRVEPSQTGHRRLATVADRQRPTDVQSIENPTK